MTLGVVVARRRSASPVTIPLTDADSLEIGRMLHGEGGASDRAHAAVLVWTVIQRWQWLPRWQNSTFIDFLRQFSQPLMREQLRGGSDCMRNGRDITTGFCDEEHVSRRAIIQDLRWDQLSDVAASTASAFVAGDLPNPVPGSIDFAAWPIGSTRTGYVPVARFRNNVFYGYKVAGGQDTTRWRGDEIYVQKPDGARSRAGLRSYGVLGELPLFVGHLLTGGR